MSELQGAQPSVCDAIVTLCSACRLPICPVCEKPVTQVCAKRPRKVHRGKCERRLHYLLTKTGV